MYGSLFWIEWLERLDRVLNSARADLLSLARVMNPRGLASIERSARQLTALSSDLRLLDRGVLSGGDTSAPDAAEGLQRALDTALIRLGALAEIQAATTPAMRERLLGSIDAALRESRFEATALLAPKRRRA